MNIHLNFCRLVAGMSDESLDQLMVQQPSDHNFLKHFSACFACRNRMEQVFTNSFDALCPGLGETMLGLIESTTEDYIVEIKNKRS
jgi:hypothetical protein